MEKDTTVKTDNYDNSTTDKAETDSTVSSYIFDISMDEYFYDTVYYNEKCFLCKHWLVYDCGAPNGLCDYKQL